MDKRQRILAAAAAAYDRVPDDGSPDADTAFEAAMREAEPGLYAFADEFDKMSDDEKAAVLSSRWYGGTGQ